MFKGRIKLWVRNENISIPKSVLMVQTLIIYLSTVKSMDEKIEKDNSCGRGELELDPLVRVTDQGIRIRTKMSRIPNTAPSRKPLTHHSALVEGSPAFLATFFCDLDGRNSVARQRMVYSGQQVSEWFGLYTYLGSRVREYRTCRDNK